MCSINTITVFNFLKCHGYHQIRCIMIPHLRSGWFMRLSNKKCSNEMPMEETDKEKYFRNQGCWNVCGHCCALLQSVRLLYAESVFVGREKLLQIYYSRSIHPWGKCSHYFADWQGWQVATYFIFSLQFLHLFPFSGGTSWCFHGNMHLWLAPPF